MTNQKQALSVKDRLKAASISEEELCDYVWGAMERRVRAMLSNMAAKWSQDRHELLCAVVSGLAVRWKELNESPQEVAELAERLVNAVLREEAKRVGQ